MNAGTDQAERITPGRLHAAPSTPGNGRRAAQTAPAQYG